MNRRTFFATLFAAPLAAVAALKAKPRPRVFLNGIEQADASSAYTLGDTTRWSNARSTPIEDIQRAMAKIRLNARPVGPEYAYIPPDHVVIHLSVSGTDEVIADLRKIERRIEDIRRAT